MLQKYGAGLRCGLFLRTFAAGFCSGLLVRVADNPGYERLNGPIIDGKTWFSDPAYPLQCIICSKLCQILIIMVERLTKGFKLLLIDPAINPLTSVKNCPFMF